MITSEGGHTGHGGTDVLDMAWEWVSPVSAVAGASVGAVTTWLTGAGGRRHARDISESASRHAERMAAEERRQQRIADAYVELLTSVERMGHWCQLTKPTFASGNQPVVELPQFDEQARVQALVGAYGSKLVRELYDQYQTAVWAVVHASEDIDFAAQHGRDAGPPSAGELRKKLHLELRPAEVAMRGKLREQVATELAGDGSET
jgi:hypothetical protein